MIEAAYMVLIQVLLASFGGLARQLYSKENKRLGNVALLKGCAIAAFIGAMNYFITASIHLEANLAFAFSGLCGWIGPSVIDLFSEYLMKKVGMKQ
ncbi:MAG: phage holin family protein [Clostridiales bacterium]|nr:phage holin family protein [Clostridiales bacterium]MDR2749035.1 phage holin family protein [Clostridiales bacterium]